MPVTIEVDDAPLTRLMKVDSELEVLTMPDGAALFGGVRRQSKRR